MRANAGHAERNDASADVGESARGRSRRTERVSREVRRARRSHAVLQTPGFLRHPRSSGSRVRVTSALQLTAAEAWRPTCMSDLDLRELAFTSAAISGAHLDASASLGQRSPVSHALVSSAIGTVRACRLLSLPYVSR